MRLREYPLPTLPAPQLATLRAWYLYPASVTPAAKGRAPEPPAPRASLGTFAIGTGSFVFAGLLEGVAKDLSVSVTTAGHLVTVFAVTCAVNYAVSSPVLAECTRNVALSLNASGVYLGQGAGAFLGALVLDL